MRRVSVLLFQHPCNEDKLFRPFINVTDIFNLYSIFGVIFNVLCRPASYLMDLLYPSRLLYTKITATVTSLLGYFLCLQSNTITQHINWTTAQLLSCQFHDKASSDLEHCFSCGTISTLCKKFYKDWNDELYIYGLSIKTETLLNVAGETSSGCVNLR